MKPFCNNTRNKNEEDNSIKFGKYLANPSTGEEVVVSGISGQYPLSENIHQLRDNLFSKIDMVTDGHRRWDFDHPEINHRTGKLLNISKFDAGFFGVHSRQAATMEPMVRMLLEAALSAIIDAGLHPEDLSGTKTGVFIGTGLSETEVYMFNENRSSQGYAITGCSRSMYANRISYFLKLKGPSFTCDTGCSSSLYAVEHAYKAIRSGQCDSAIVGGSSLCLNPYVSVKFEELGITCPDGFCKSFDKNANGYVRSEGIVAMLLQKAEASKRIYLTILHAKSNSDGFKDSGISCPSAEMQSLLLKELYIECEKIKPSELTYLEAHGTATKLGDAAELQSAAEIFLPGRSTPLLIGSIKSNMGHTEFASGVSAISKAVIAAETKYIAPNRNFMVPRPESKHLLNGDLKVVTEKTPFSNKNGYIGINNFGWGGSNCHALFKPNAKVKQNYNTTNEIPKLVCVSGRTYEAVEILLSDVKENNFDAEHIGLLQNIFRQNIAGHVYRGFVVASRANEIFISENVKMEEPNLILCLGSTLKYFTEHPIILNTLNKLQKRLRKYRNEVTFTDIILKSEKNSLAKNLLADFIFQMLLLEFIKKCDLKPSKILAVKNELGLEFLVVDYFKENISFEEAIEKGVTIASKYEINDNKYTILKNRTHGKINQQKLKTDFCNDEIKFNIFNLSSKNEENLLSQNKFRSTISKKLVFYEVGNGDIINSIKKEFSTIKEKNCITSGLAINDFVTSLGRLYEKGINPQIQNLYPKISFPVSNGTPMISPKIKWNHHQDWFIKFSENDQKLFLKQIEFHKQNKEVSLQQAKICNKNITISAKDSDYSYLEGHVVDGRNLVPGIFFLQIMCDMIAPENKNVKFVYENCKLKRPCIIPDDKTITLEVSINKVTGKFEVLEGGSPVFSGRVNIFPTNDDLSDFEITNLSEMSTESPCMSTKDVYKELKLKGFDYRDQFKAVKYYDVDRQFAKITWNNNLVTFMDNMVHLVIAEIDSRKLYVPVSIDKIVIDMPRHLKYVKNTREENPDLPVFVTKCTRSVRSGGLEMTGINAFLKEQRKYFESPLIEKHVFIENFTSLTAKLAIRVNVQIILENLYSNQVKIVELVDKVTAEKSAPLNELIMEAFVDQPIIKPQIVILQKNENLLSEKESTLVIATGLLEQSNILQFALGSVQKDGFLLSRESLEVNVTNYETVFNILTVFRTENEQLVLFKPKADFELPTIIKISSEDKNFKWLQKLQKSMAEKENILLLAQHEPFNGVLGLLNCIRKESDGVSIKLCFLMDEADNFDIFSPFYQNQIRKGLAINILKNKKWGSYRHLPLKLNFSTSIEHSYLTNLVKGDLSTLKWVEGPLSVKTNLESEKTLVSIYYAAVNFKDVSIATGRIKTNIASTNKRQHEYDLGFEFSGRTSSGRRVCGMGINKSCSTLIEVDPNMLLEVPDFLTLEDAATIPVAYGTVFYALYKLAKIKPEHSVLIYGGSGSVGQAAITLALHLGCTVYIAVETYEDNELVQNMYPNIKSENILISSENEFEKQLMRLTAGKGINILLNCISQKKLMSLVRCLSKNGKFIELGNNEFIKDSELDLLLLAKGASFHGCSLDKIFHNDLEIEVASFLKKNIQNGVIRPLNRSVFCPNQAEEAYRCSANGKSIEKVLIEIRKEEKLNIAKPLPMEYSALSRYHCDSRKSYIICGGLGGLGLELADWLILRGCRNLVLTSRTGVQTGYQARRISLWESYGCVVKISTDDITTYNGCIDLISTAKQLGPIEAIFNLAAILKGSLLVNETVESFKESFGPKAYATEHLDKVSRKYCPDLRDFVVFSSVSCGRGNPGVSNYSMANSVIERICEKRKSDGLPGLAIQWGFIVDIGITADVKAKGFKVEYLGMLEQTISSCLQLMDTFLKQTESAVVSSIVIAEKESETTQTDNVVTAVSNIIGLKDLKSISLQSTFAELGMDSIIAVDIIKTLERRCDVTFTYAELKAMTFGKLIELQNEDSTESK